MGPDSFDIELIVNSEPVSATVAPAELLLDFLRERLGLTGAKRSCDVQVCGTCTVLVDGGAVSSCTYLAFEAHGREVLTIEGFERDGKLHALQEAFSQEHGLQCGFCTPGMITRAYRLLQEIPHPTEEQIRTGMAGNLCRCTGYQNIVKAVLAAAEKLSQPQAA